MKTLLLFLVIISTLFFKFSAYAADFMPKDEKDRIEKLHKAVDNHYARLKKDAQMTDKRIDVVCKIYEQEFIIYESYPKRYKSVSNLMPSLDFCAMTSSQKQNVSDIMNGTNRKLIKLFQEYKVGPYVSHALLRRPNYCEFQFELKKAQ